MRVATYNLYLGADLTPLFRATDLDELAAAVRAVRAQLDATRPSERAAAAAAVLARDRPDLLGLQEVSRWTLTTASGDSRVLVDVLPTLLDVLDSAGCGYDAHAVNHTFAGSLPVPDGMLGLRGSNVVLVRRSRRLEVTGVATGSFATRLEIVTGIDGVTFPVERGWASVDATVDGRPLRLVTTHAEAYDDRVRDAQVHELLAGAAGADVGPVVLVGDLNATPEEVALPTGWTDAWVRGEGDGFSWGRSSDLDDPTSTLERRIDHIWVRGADVTAARVVGDRAEDRSAAHGLWPSDHACVVADLEL